MATGPFGQSYEYFKAPRLEHLAYVTYMFAKSCFYCIFLIKITQNLSIFVLGGSMPYKSELNISECQATDPTNISR